jgi:hypothetical protein
MANNEVRTEALNYLVVWKQSKDTWKFQKSKQIWLLKNMYSVDAIPSKHFKIMKKYVKSLQGQVRERILEEALAVVETPKKLELTLIEKALEEEAKEQMKEVKISRYEKIAAILS